MEGNGKGGPQGAYRAYGLVGEVTGWCSLRRRPWLWNLGNEQRSAKLGVKKDDLGMAVKGMGKGRGFMDFKSNCESTSNLNGKQFGTYWKDFTKSNEKNMICFMQVLKSTQFIFGIIHVSQNWIRANNWVCLKIFKKFKILVVFTMFEIAGCYRSTPLRRISSSRFWGLARKGVVTSLHGFFQLIGVFYLFRVSSFLWIASVCL